MRYVIIVFLLVFVLVTNLQLGDAQTIRYNINDPGIIAIINGKTVTGKTFSFFEEQLKKVNRFKSKNSLMYGLITNQLLAEYHLDQLKKNNIKLSDEIMQNINDEYLLVVKQILSINNMVDIEKKSKTYIVESKTTDIEKVISFFPKKNKNKTLISSKAYRKALYGKEAEKYILLSYRFPNRKKGVITLYELLKQQNPHGITEILAVNSRFLEEAVQKIYLKNYIFYLADMPQNIHDVTLKEAYRLVKYKHIKKAYLDSLKTDINPKTEKARDVLRKKIMAVPQKRVGAYFIEHKEKFKEVKSVNARHIRLKDEKTARVVEKKLEKGAVFKEMVVKYSISPDKKGSDPGRLPVIHNNGNKNLSFLHRICLFQVKGKPSKYMRTPKGYEIIMVDERIEGYRDPQDKSLVNDISKKILIEDKNKALKKTKASLFKKSVIQINKNLLGGRLNAEK